MKDFKKQMHPTRRVYPEGMVLFPLVWVGYEILGQIARVLKKYDIAAEYSKRAKKLAKTPNYIWARMKPTEVLKAKVPPLNYELYDPGKIRYQTRISDF